MKKKIILNIFFYGIGDFIVTAVTAFLLIPVYVKYLNPAEYAVLNILNNNVSIFTYIFQFGIISAFSRLYFYYLETNDEIKYLNTLIIFHLIFSGIFIFSVFLLSHWVFGFLSPSVPKQLYNYYSVIVAFLAFLPNLYYALIRVKQRATVFVFFQIFTVSLILASIGLLIGLHQFTLLNLLLCLLFANFVIWATVVCIFIRRFQTIFIFSFVEKTLKVAFPIFISYVAYFAISRYSVVILQRYIPLKVMGQFALAQQVAMIPTLVALGLTKALQPHIFSSKNDIEFTRKSDTVDFFYKMLMLFISGALILFAKDIANVLLPARYRNAMEFAPLLIFANMIYNFSFVENSILLFKLNTKAILLILVASALLNLLLSNILVHSFSILGVEVAMVCAMLMSFLLQAFYARKYIKITYKWKPISIGLILIVAYYMIITLAPSVYYVAIYLFKFGALAILGAFLYSSIRNLNLV